MTGEATVQSVTCDSFLEVMALFGETAAVEAEKLLAIIDESGDGEIDFVEFLSLMVSRNATIQEIVRSQIVSYREMFHLFDEDADGCVSDDDILNTLHRLGMRRVTHPQVQLRAIVISHCLPFVVSSLFLFFLTQDLKSCPSHADSLPSPPFLSFVSLSCPFTSNIQSYI